MVPRAAASLDEAHAAIELWEHYSRKVLDPAQRLTVEVMMAETADGGWAAQTTGREMPRQQGKGDEIEVPELWGLVQRAEAILHTVHDAVLLASQAQQRMLGVLEGHADLRRLVKRKWQGTGQQMIEMRNGGIIWYRTRTGGGGRGVDDIDRLVVDEAQHATEEHLAAVAPTLLANKNPQLNAMGTAGLVGKSSWWWSVRKRALSPDPGMFGYVGHTAETVYLNEQGHVVQVPVDVQDRSLWMRANPAIAAGRGQGMPFLEEQLRRLGPVAFAQEHLGVWAPELGAAGSALPLDRWIDSANGERDGDPQVFAVDVAPEQASASIAGGGLSGGVAYAALLENHPNTGWVVPKLLELKQAHPKARFIAPTGAPTGSLFGDAAKAGVDIEPVTVAQHAAACSALLAKVVEGRMRHRPDALLDAALAGAVRKDMGDGAWLWSRKNSLTDISPLVAFTLALDAVTEAAKPVFAY